MLDRLHRHFRLSLRRCACAVAILAISVAAQADPEGANGPNPDNVLTRQPDIVEKMRQLMQPGAAMAAQRPAAEQRGYRKRAKAKAAEPVATVAQPNPAQPLPDVLSQPFWPNAQASAGMGDITPLVIKTVREMLEADTQSVVLANELSDLDIAVTAQPMPAATTDGRASADPAESEAAAADAGGRFGATVAALKEATFASGSWLGALLLMLSGALAALAALSAARRLA